MTLTKTVDLHVAIVSDLRSRLPEMLASTHVTGFTDGDSWEDWGEPLTEGSPIPQHVVIRTDSRTRALALISVLHDSLIPMTYPHQRGVIAAVTDSDDWSEEVLNLVDHEALAQVEALTFVRGVDPHRLWEHAAWRTYVENRNLKED